MNRVGSLLCPYFTEHDVVDYETAKLSNIRLFTQYYAAMLKSGVLTAPSPFEAMFVSAAHSDEDIETTITAHDQALRAIMEELGR